jgi:alkylation response protein AidB-like acyl-CoA dehydrogenase
MDVTFTEEHDELRETVRRFLDAKSPETAVRALMTSERGYDPSVWSQMAEQMGLQGLIVPEAHGGAGLGPVELAIVCEEMGSALLCAPFLSSAVLVPAMLLEAGSQAACAAILPEIAAGRALATVAVSEQAAPWDLAALGMQARRDGSRWRLDGVKTFVLDGHVADVVLVVAPTEAGLSIFRVDGGAAGLERTLLPTLDLTRKLARCSFTGVAADEVGASADCTGGIERALARTAAALAAEQAGGARRCLELSTEYAKTRLQFGRPIGSFQAIKHLCADMLVQVEFAKSAAYHAAFAAPAAGGGADECRAAASLAKSYCSEAFLKAAGDTIQIHGGMGFTWEHAAHLYFKRAKSSALLFGDPVRHRESLAAHLGL